MLGKLLDFGAFFLAILLILGIYIGYGVGINALSATIAIIISLIGASTLVKITNKAKPQKNNLDLVERIKQKKWFILIFLVLGLLLFTMLPADLVFPATCSDFMNHARTTRVNAKDAFFFESGNPVMIASGIPLIYIHHYPIGYYAVTSQIYSVVPNTYLVNTFIGILLILLTSLCTYLVALKTTSNEKIALLSLYICSFAITTLWIFEHGFLPQMLATFFLMTALYAFVSKKKLLWLFSAAGMISYPPLLAVMGLFVIVDFVIKTKIKRSSMKKEFNEYAKYFILVFVGMLIVFPETIGIALQYITVEKYLNIIFLIKGGIFTPNLFGLLPFVFVFIGLYVLVIKKTFTDTRPTLSLIIACALLASAVAASFLINIFIHFNPISKIHQLYQAVKYFYFALIPASIFAGIGVKYLLTQFTNKKNKFKYVKYIVIFILAFELIYFAGYTNVLVQKDSEPAGFYIIAEQMDALPAGFVLGVDQCMVEIDKMDNPWCYQSLLDNPDPAGPNLCRLIEVTRAFQFHWATHKADTTRFRIFANDGTEVIKIGDEVILDETGEGSNVDYFLTACREINKPILFEEGTIRVYEMK